jgi:hypothetical protein
MDERLRKLQRATESEPSDVDAARSYERQLRAGGEHEALEARFRFEYACAQRFEDLSATSDPFQRDCERCARRVVYVRDVATLTEAVAAGRCVAFDQAQVGHAFRALSTDESLHAAHVEGSPCVVESERAVIALDLDQVPIEPGLPNLFDPWMLRHYMALPLRSHQGELEVAWACSDPAPPVFRDELCSVSGAVRVRFLLATRDQVEAGLERYAPEPELLMGIAALDEDPLAPESPPPPC